MAKNYIQEGNIFSHVATEPLVSGQVVLVESLLGVCMSDAAAGEGVEIATEGVFSLPASTEEIKAGAKVYWAAAGDPVGGPAGSGAATATETGNTYAGLAWATKSAGVGQVLVKIGA